MTVKEIILQAAEMIGCAEKVRAYLSGGTDGETEANTLLRCFNRVENEVALDYLPLFAEDEVETETGVVPFSLLSKAAVRIVKATDEWGNPLSFTLLPDRIRSQPGRVKIVYTYTPEEKELDGEAEGNPKASLRLFAYGVAAEYCLATGLYEESAVWEKKYKQAIEAAYRSSARRKIKSRRWA